MCRHFLETVGLLCIQRKNFVKSFSTLELFTNNQQQRVKMKAGIRPWNLCAWHPLHRRVAYSRHLRGRACETNVKPISVYSRSHTTFSILASTQSCPILTGRVTKSTTHKISLKAQTNMWCRHVTLIINSDCMKFAAALVKVCIYKAKLVKFPSRAYL